MRYSPPPFQCTLPTQFPLPRHFAPWLFFSLIPLYSLSVGSLPPPSPPSLMLRASPTSVKLSPCLKFIIPPTCVPAPRLGHHTTVRPPAPSGRFLSWRGSPLRTSSSSLPHDPTQDLLLFNSDRTYPPPHQKYGISLVDFSFHADGRFS